MNKDNFQQELLQKIKPGTKPSDLKNLKNKNDEKAVCSDFLISPSHQKNNTPASSPPASPIIAPLDKQIKQNLQPESILSPPIEIEQEKATNRHESPVKNKDKALIKQLQEQVNFHAQQAQSYLVSLQRTTAELDQAEEQTKELQSQPIQFSQETEQALKEANQKIRELEAKNKNLIKTIQELKTPNQNPKETKPEIKIFTCANCQQTQALKELSRVFNNFSFCRTCSQKARKQAQQAPETFICHTCEKEHLEIPTQMKLDKTLQAYPICSTCRPNLKEFNEADLITDELWAKYPYSSASEILAKEFNIKTEEKIW